MIQRVLHSGVARKLLIILQLSITFGIYIHSRTSLLWIWSVLSFIPSIIICFFTFEKRYILASLALLFVSQQAVFIFANTHWGFAFGSDAINDFHTASLMSESPNFELGQLSYASRPSYSYYPMVHLFSVALSEISGVPLTLTAVYVIPILSAMLTALSLFCLNHDLFGLDGRMRNVATLLFGTSFYYTAFDSQFTRETFAFPLILLTLWIFSRIAKSQHPGYATAAPILISAVILSHQMSSYIFLIISIIIVAGFNIFNHNRKLNSFLFLTTIALGAYTTFVVLSFSITQWAYAFEGIQAIFNREGSHTILRSYSTYSIFLSYSYYAILGILGAIGWIKLLRERKKDLTTLTLVAFLTLAFAMSILLRLSTSADPWSWTYYMALRGTIWAFMGISVVAVIGLVYVLKLNNTTRKGFLALLLVICVLAAGKFSQNPSLVTDPSNTPVTYPRYVAALWLKEEAIHGSGMLVAPYTSDINAFEASRDMAPYAYLNEYFIDETKGRTYDKFIGYIPFVGEYYEQYVVSSGIDMIYSNGYAEVGYKQR